MNSHPKQLLFFRQLTKTICLPHYSSLPGPPLHHPGPWHWMVPAEASRVCKLSAPVAAALHQACIVKINQIVYTDLGCLCYAGKASIDNWWMDRWLQICCFLLTCNFIVLIIKFKPTCFFARWLCTEKWQRCCTPVPHLRAVLRAGTGWYSIASRLWTPSVTCTRESIFFLDQKIILMIFNVFSGLNISL